MAVNSERSMNVDFHQGVIDRSYIQLTPDRGGIVENPPVERLAWPRFGYCEQLNDNPHIEAIFVQATKPVEHVKNQYGDQRY